MNSANYLIHYGLPRRSGRYEWGSGERPYQGDNLSRSDIRRLERMDRKWVRKSDKSIRRYATNQTRDAMREYDRTELRKNYAKYNKNGKISANYANAYNRKLTELMNAAIGDVEAPSGKVIRFVAKRGEIGVYTALASKNYDMSQVKNGVNSSMRVAYRKDTVNTIEEKRRRR